MTCLLAISCGGSRRRYLLLSKSASPTRFLLSFFSAWQQPPAQSLTYLAASLWRRNPASRLRVTTDRNGELVVTNDLQR